MAIDVGSGNGDTDGVGCARATDRPSELALVLFLRYIAASIGRDTRRNSGNVESAPTCGSEWVGAGA